MDNLSMDVSRATRAGMSYGYWKAMNPYTKDESEVVPEGIRICPCCGESFYTKNKQTVYCSVSCARKQANRRAYERKMALAKG